MHSKVVANASGIFRGGVGCSYTAPCRIEARCDDLGRSFITAKGVSGGLSPRAIQARNMITNECVPHAQREADVVRSSNATQTAPQPVVLVVRGLPQEHERVLERIVSQYKEIFEHDGYGHICIEMRFLKRTQKEILVRCGKDYRYVVDYDKASVEE